MKNKYLEQYKAAKLAWEDCKPGTIAQMEAWCAMIRAFLKLGEDYIKSAKRAD